jgi:hypothetical protein
MLFNVMGVTQWIYSQAVDSCSTPPNPGFASTAPSWSQIVSPVVNVKSSSTGWPKGVHSRLDTQLNGGCISRDTKASSLGLGGTGTS